MHWPIATDDDLNPIPGPPIEVPVSFSRLLSLVAILLQPQTRLRSVSSLAADVLRLQMCIGSVVPMHEGTWPPWHICSLPDQTCLSLMLLPAEGQLDIIVARSSSQE